MDKSKTMETKQASVKSVALSYGALLGIVSILLGVIAYVMNVHLERPWWLSVLSLAAMVLFIIYGIKSFKKENDGFLSLGEAIKVGLAIALVSGIIGVLYQYVFVSFIEPDYVNQMVEMTEQKMLEDNPGMPEEQREMAISMTRKFMSPGIMAAIGIIVSLFLGFIISLIGGLVMKQNRPE